MAVQCSDTSLCLFSVCLGCQTIFLEWRSAGLGLQERRGFLVTDSGRDSCPSLYEGECMVERNEGEDYGEPKTMKMRLCSNQYQTLGCAKENQIHAYNIVRPETPTHLQSSRAKCEGKAQQLGLNDQGKVIKKHANDRASLHC